MHPCYSMFHIPFLLHLCSSWTYFLKNNCLPQTLFLPFTNQKPVHTRAAGTKLEDTNAVIFPASISLTSDDRNGQTDWPTITAMHALIPLHRTNVFGALVTFKLLWIQDHFISLKIILDSSSFCLCGLYILICPY